MKRIHIGCAGWTVPKEHAAEFPSDGSHLSRYAGRFRAVEINSSFYRPHRPATYAKWAASVADDFVFSVKVPKEITHIRRLADVTETFRIFLQEALHLGSKLGVLLVQLPPSLTFENAVAQPFFAMIRSEYDGDIACEPRHVSWFTPAVSDFLESARVARVAADPAIIPVAAEPGGWKDLVYYRLHGSPDMYYSSYSTEYLETLTAKLAAHANDPSAAGTRSVWAIFDNTARGAAIVNALDVLKRFP